MQNDFRGIRTAADEESIEKSPGPNQLGYHDWNLGWFALLRKFSSNIINI